MQLRGRRGNGNSATDRMTAQKLIAFETAQRRWKALITTSTTSVIGIGRLRYAGNIANPNPKPLTVTLNPNPGITPALTILSNRCNTTWAERMRAPFISLLPQLKGSPLKPNPDPDPNLSP